MPPVSRTISLGGGLPTFVVSVSSVTTDLNVYNRLISAGWNGTSAVRAVVNITATVYSTTTATAAIIIASLPALSKVYVNISSGIVVAGCGGAGGGLWYTATNGSPGGPAIYTRNTTYISNLGTIGGGGGGGGMGRSIYEVSYNNWLGGGGGGGGASYAAPGVGMSFAGWTPGASGAGGGLAAGGAGGAGGYAAAYDYTDPDNPVLVYTMQAGNGGVGGALGSAGATGGEGYLSIGGELIHSAASGGGTAGNAIDGVSYCTLTTAGTIVGPTVN